VSAHFRLLHKPTENPQASIIHYSCSTTSPARIPHRRISMDSNLDADSCDLASVTVLPTDEYGIPANDWANKNGCKNFDI